MSLPTLKERRSVTDGASAGRYRWSENPDSSPTIRTVSVETWQSELHSFAKPCFSSDGWIRHIFEGQNIVWFSGLQSVPLFLFMSISVFFIWLALLRIGKFGELCTLFSRRNTNDNNRIFCVFWQYSYCRTNPPCVKGRFHSVFSRSLESNQRSFNIDQSKCQSVWTRCDL